MRVQVRNCPYMSMSEREEVLSDHQRRALAGEVKHQILMSTLAAVKKAGRRAAAVHSMDKQQHRRALSNHAVNFFWNYNTVRSTPLYSNSLSSPIFTRTGLLVCFVSTAASHLPPIGCGSLLVSFVSSCAWFCRWRVCYCSVRSW